MPFELTHPADTAARVEGEPFYQLAAYTIRDVPTVPPQWRHFAFRVRAFKVLPPCDAVGLLSGDDSTGLVVWSGALALLEWLLCSPQHLDSILCSASSTAVDQTSLVVELGCGSGIATVGLFAQLRERRRQQSSTATPATSSHVHLVATDGNAECVALASRNITEQCVDATGSAVKATADSLPWGDADAVTRLLRCSGNAGALHYVRITIISADVLYDAAAVPLLVSTVAMVAAAAAKCGDTPCDAAASRLHWWLAYTPRSLTRAGNEHIYDTLLASLGQHGWAYEQHPLPAGSVTTGFEESSECDTPALRGCIFVVSVTASAYQPTSSASSLS